MQRPLVLVVACLALVPLPQAQAQEGASEVASATAVAPAAPARAPLVTALSADLVAAQAAGGSSPELAGRMGTSLGACATGPKRPTPAILEGLAGDLASIVATSSLGPDEISQFADMTCRLLGHSGAASEEGRAVVEEVQGLLAPSGADPGQVATVVTGLMGILETGGRLALQSDPIAAKAELAATAKTAKEAEPSKEVKKSKRKKKKQQQEG